MSEYETLLLDIDTERGVATITFNRPELLNAYNRSMQQELLAVARDLDEDSNVGAVVLTGAGRGFMAGADISMFEDWSGRSRESVLSTLRNETIRPVMWQEFGKPVIAAVNGVAVGAGLATAMAADFRFASPHATFGHTAIKMGIIPGAGETAQTITHLGRTLAAEVLLAGRILTAQDAWDAGMLNRLVEDADELVPAAQAYAAELTEIPPANMRLAKLAFGQAPQARLEYEAELERFATSMTSAEARERFQAFLAAHNANGGS